MSTRPVALVTGANRGLGLQMAKDLFAKGYSVVLGCRDVGRGRAAMTEIAKPYEDEVMEEGHKLSVIKLDLEDAASIDAAVEEYKRYNDRLDVLVNNAGVYDKDRQKCLVTNFFNTMVVTEAFLPLLKASKPGKTTKSRIVIVSSRMGVLKTAAQGDALNLLSEQDANKLDLEKIIATATAFGEGSDDTGFSEPYCASKACISAYGRVLATRLEKEGAPVTVNVTCPGYCKTEMNGFQGPRSVKDGAETIVWAATDPEFDNVSGKFFGDHKEISYFE